MKLLSAFLVFLASFVLSESCKTDSDCMSDATCRDEECSCKKGYIISSDGTKCLPYITEYFGQCSENAQCEWLGSNSECEFVCKCKKGYRWYEGKCQKYVGLGEKCTDSIECFDGYNLESLECSGEEGQKVCSCSEGYYSRGKTDCRKIASNIGDICALNIDCQVPGQDTVCLLGKCDNSTSFLLEKEVIEESRFSYVASTKTCEAAEDCQEIINSECYDKTGTCICKRGYFFNDDGTKCIAEIGILDDNNRCFLNSDCPIKPGKCVDGVCYCRDYYFTEESNRNCIKTISQNNANCLSKEWCYAMGQYSYCSSDGVCKCSKIAKENKDLYICEKEQEEPEDRCTDDYQCQNITNGFCVDEECGCKKGYSLKDNKCIPEIESPCDDQIKCEIENSDCVEGKCQCIQNYVHEDNLACYSEQSLNGTCEIDLQCSSKVSYAICMNKTCACNDDHLPYEDSCYPKREYLSYCNSLEECTLSLGNTSGIICRKHLCQCPTSQSLNDEGRCSSGTRLMTNLFLLSIVILLKNCSQ